MDDDDDNDDDKFENEDVEEGKSPIVNVANARPVFVERREDVSQVRMPQVTRFVLPPIVVLLPSLVCPAPSIRYSLLHSIRLDAARMEHVR